MSSKNLEFQECAACAAKPGSPVLCDSCLHNRRAIGKLQPPKIAGRQNPKQFRISQLNVNRINVDTESSNDGRQDIVVSLVDRDGSHFEVKRISVHDEDVFAGESTSVAKLTCRRSWGTEGVDKDDDSVSCPLCLFQGHGAGSCKQRR